MNRDIKFRIANSQELKDLEAAIPRKVVGTSDCSCSGRTTKLDSMKDTDDVIRELIIL
jgi:hypothetical protein